MKLAFVVACSALFASVAAYSQAPSQPSNTESALAATTTQIDPAKEADIRRLLDLTGAAGLATQMMNQMEQNIRPLMMSSLPPGDYRDKLIDLFLKKFNSKVDSKQLIALIIPVYDKYYSDSELKTLIQFYESPTGKKVAATMPKVMAESQAVGAGWGQELGRNCMVEVLQEHPELRQALESAKPNSQP